MGIQLIQPGKLKCLIFKFVIKILRLFKCLRRCKSNEVCCQKSVAVTKETACCIVARSIDVQSLVANNQQEANANTKNSNSTETDIIVIVGVTIGYI